MPNLQDDTPVHLARPLVLTNRLQRRSWLDSRWEVVRAAVRASEALVSPFSWPPAPQLSLVAARSSQFNEL